MTDLPETGLCLEVSIATEHQRRVLQHVERQRPVKLKQSCGLKYQIKCTKKGKNTSYPIVFDGTIKHVSSDKKYVCQAFLKNVILILSEMQECSPARNLNVYQTRLVAARALAQALLYTVHLRASAAPASPCQRRVFVQTWFGPLLHFKCQ